jgi:hypothetical protein
MIWIPKSGLLEVYKVLKKFDYEYTKEKMTTRHSAPRA